jgi:DNA-binding MarR family transcriptional regulator
MSAADVRLVQTCYPQIDLACHTRHVRAASSVHRLSARDSSLLSHLDEKRPMPPSALARHLGVSPSTMSAAIKRLVRLGYVVQKPHPSDARRLQLFLSSKGTAAMRATSVLDADRVQGVLDALKGSERRRALDGLALFAKAARAMMEG